MGDAIPRQGDVTQGYLPTRCLSISSGQPHSRESWGSAPPPSAEIAPPVGDVDKPLEVDTPVTATLPEPTETVPVPSPGAPSILLSNEAEHEEVEHQTDRGGSEMSGSSIFLYDDDASSDTQTEEIADIRRKAEAQAKTAESLAAERQSVELARVREETERAFAAELERARSEAAQQHSDEMARVQAEAEHLRKQAYEEARLAAESEARALEAELAQVKGDAETRIATAVEQVKADAETARAAEMAELETRSKETLEQKLSEARVAAQAQSTQVLEARTEWASR